MKSDQQAIKDVECIALNTICDLRGDLTEISRLSWINSPHPIQWNYVRSKPNVIRGFHVHYNHHDYLILLEGRMELGLRDMRPESASFGITTIVSLQADKKCLVHIPPGVGHVFYFLTESSLVYSVSHYFDPHDELGCVWYDPQLNFPWKDTKAILSDRDANAPSYEELQQQFEALWQSVTETK